LVDSFEWGVKVWAGIICLRTEPEGEMLLKNVTNRPTISFSRKALLQELSHRSGRLFFFYVTHINSNIQGPVEITHINSIIQGPVEIVN
jgi:hypothetical protein